MIVMLQVPNSSHGLGQICCLLGSSNVEHACVPLHSMLACAASADATASPL